MSYWLVGFIAAGVWFGVMYLEKISRSAEDIRKNVSGIRYQLEQSEKRLTEISVRLHDLRSAITPPLEGRSNWWRDTFQGGEE